MTCQWQWKKATYKVVYDISQRPNHWHAEEGYAQEHNVKDSDTERVGQPDASTVHDPGVWVHLTVCHPYIHSGLKEEKHMLMTMSMIKGLVLQKFLFYL